MKKLAALLIAALISVYCIAEEIPADIIGRLDVLGYETADIENAISNFQRANGLGVTGVLDPATQKAILSEKAMPQSSYIRNFLKPGEYPRESFPGESGRSVKQLQSRLEQLGYAVPTEGVYDWSTLCAVARFQALNSLELTGKCDAVTLERLYSQAAIPFDVSGDVYALETGASGATVKALQNSLKALGYYTGTCTGVFGTATARAVREFQKANELDINGRWSIEQQMLIIAGTPKTKSETDEYKASLTLGVGTQHECVRELEELLHGLGYFSEVPDDIYDASTQSAVRVFQEANGLKITGTADPETRALAADDSCIRHDTYYQSAMIKAVRPGDSGYAVLLCSRRLIELDYPLFEKWVYDDEMNAMVTVFCQAAGLYDAVGADMETRALMNSDTALRYEEAKPISDAYAIEKARTDRINTVLDTARSAYGKPYEAGKTGPDSYGTAGLVWCCYYACGTEIPATVSTQLEEARNSSAFSVNMDDIAEAWQVFFIRDNTVFTGICMGGRHVIAAVPEENAVKLYDIATELADYEFIGCIMWP